MRLIFLALVHKRVVAENYCSGFVISFLAPGQGESENKHDAADIRLYKI